MKEQWHLDDEGRLHQTMRAMDRTKIDWHGLPVATTRGAKLADRLINGVIVILHAGVAVAMGGFALVTLGFINLPEKDQRPVTVVESPRPTLPAIGSDLCGK